LTPAAPLASPSQSLLPRGRLGDCTSEGLTPGAAFQPAAPILHNPNPLDAAPRMDDLRSDLWYSGGLAITVLGPEGESRVRLGQPYARVGAHSNADVVLSGEGVPLRCLYLHATAAGVFCAPLIEESAGPALFHGWVAPGQEIAVGPYLLAIAQGAEGSEPQPAPSAKLDAKSLPAELQPTLVIDCGNGQRTSRKLPRPLTIIGRTHPSAVRLKSSRISSCHCALYWDGEAAYVVDLLSGNGTTLSEAPVESTRLPFGQTLHLGGLAIDLAAPSRSPQSASLPRTAGGGRWKTAADAEAEVRELERQTVALGTELERLRLARREAEATLGAEIERMQESLAAQNADWDHERTAWRQERSALEEQVRQLSQQLERAQAELKQREALLGRHVKKGESERQARDTEFAQERTAWDEERQRLQNQLAQEDRRFRKAQEEARQVEKKREARVCELEQELAERDSLWERERGELRKQLTLLASQIEVSQRRSAGPPRSCKRSSLACSRKSATELMRGGGVAN
jgi:pSer/pThr/pTyr-binding forkhead associated (FHA) protein